MKSIRQKLLARHSHIEPRLDRIRTEVVASLEPARSPSIPSRRFRWPWIALWEEILLPCRRLLTGLAATWLLIATFNFIALEQSPVTLAAAPSVDQRWLITMLAEQRSLIEATEFPPVSTSPATPPPTPAQPAATKPRSERRRTSSLA